MPTSLAQFLASIFSEQAEAKHGKKDKGQKKHKHKTSAVTPPPASPPSPPSPPSQPSPPPPPPPPPSPPPPPLDPPPGTRQRRSIFPLSMADVHALTSALDELKSSGT